MKYPRPQAIWFDLDGTLLDSAPDLGAAANMLRQARGLPDLPLQHYRPLAGAGGRGMIALALGLTPQDPEYASTLEEFFIHFKARNDQDTVLFPEVLGLLHALNEEKMVWGVVTNKASRFAQSIQKNEVIFQSAHAFVCGDTTAHAKPHPAPLLHACTLGQVDPASCWYVGDDLRDIQAAHAAKMLGVAAEWGYMGETPIQQWQAEASAQTPLEILHLLKQAHSPV